jgi:inosine-uridine nucleoside N-ribohydrolase
MYSVFCRHNVGHLVQLSQGSSVPALQERAMPEPLIIDCDPGQDDAVALLLALAAPERFDLLGITTVGGNVPLSLTTTNALKMVELAGRTDVPVHAGCQNPIMLPYPFSLRAQG